MKNIFFFGLICFALNANAQPTPLNPGREGPISIIPIGGSGSVNTNGASSGALTGDVTKPDGSLTTTLSDSTVSSNKIVDATIGTNKFSVAAMTYLASLAGVTLAQLQAATNTATLGSQGLALKTETVASTNTATLGLQGIALKTETVASTNTTTLHSQGLALSTELVAATNTATLSAQGLAKSTELVAATNTTTLNAQGLATTTQDAAKQLDMLNPGNFIFLEEFTGHSSGDLTTGQNGWRVLGVGSGSSSVTLNAAASVHPGMITLTPGGTVSGGMLVMINGTTNSASDLLLPANTLQATVAFTAWTNRWIFKTGSATNDMKCWIGLVNNIVYGNAKPADFIGVELDTTNNVNIQYISGAGSTYTNVSGPLIAVSTWYDFVMYSTVNGTINFYINNANAGVINTSGNISTLGLNLLADVWKTATTSQATLTLDYCSFFGNGTAR